MRVLQLEVRAWAYRILVLRLRPLTFPQSSSTFVLQFMSLEERLRSNTRKPLKPEGSAFDPRSPGILSTGHTFTKIGDPPVMIHGFGGDLRMLGQEVRFWDVLGVYGMCRATLGFGKP